MGQVLQPCEIPFAMHLWICGELPRNKQNNFWRQALPNGRDEQKIYKGERRQEQRVANIPRGVAERVWTSLGTSLHTDAERLGWPCLKVRVPIWKRYGCFNEALVLTWYNPEHTYLSTAAELPRTPFSAETCRGICQVQWQRFGYQIPFPVVPPQEAIHLRVCWASPLHAGSRRTDVWVSSCFLLEIQRNRNQKIIMVLDVRFFFKVHLKVFGDWGDFSKCFGLATLYLD